MPVGSYFIKEAVDDDSEPLAGEINHESRQLLRYQKIKSAGARVPSTFRKYISPEGKGYFVITNLKCSPEDIVWGITDGNLPEGTKTDNINWEELAVECATNGIKATEARVFVDMDGHIITVSKGHSFDYLADLDKGVWLPEEIPARDPDSMRARNLIESLKFLIKFARAARQETKISQLCRTFWTRIRSYYPEEEPDKLSKELLGKSLLTIVFSKEDVEEIKRTFST